MVLPKEGTTGFGKRLRECREQLGLTQQQLADKVGCTKMALSRLERGVFEPSWGFLLILSKVLRMQLVVMEVDWAEEPMNDPPPRRGRGRPRKAK